MLKFELIVNLECGLEFQSKVVKINVWNINNEVFSGSGFGILKHHRLAQINNLSKSMVF